MDRVDIVATLAAKNIAGESVGGGAWLGLAKLWFLIAGYGLAVALAYLVSEATYGQYQTVARAVAVPNMVIIYTVMFAVSRPLSAEFDDGLPNYDAIRRRGLALAAGLGAIAALGMVALAPVLARWWNAPSLATPLRVVAPISLIYALYAVNVGTLNASRRFGRQAALDVTMATLKTGLMAAAAALTLGLTWIVAGFTAAATCALLLSVVLVAGVRPTRAVTVGDARLMAGEAPRVVGDAPPMVGFASALIVFTVVLNLLQSADLLILSSFSDSEALRDQTGYYASAQLVAWVPYSLMNAVALVAFPFVASLGDDGRDGADREGSAGRTRAYVGSVATAALTLLTLMSSVAAAASTEIQSLLFPSAYSAAGGHLRLLVFGFSGYSFANTVAWMCNSAGRKLAALAIVSVPLVTAVGLAFALCPSQHAHGAATAVAIAGALATVAGLVGLTRVFSVEIPWLHLLKLGGAMAAVFAVGWLVPSPADLGGLTAKLLVVAKLAALALTFVGVAFATRAVTVDQLRALRRRREPV